MGTPSSGATTAKVRRGVRALPSQFWLLAAGSTLFLTAIGLGFPYTAILIHGRFHVSMGTVGLIMGGCALAGLPLQVVGGHVSDRFGRRPVMVVAVLANATLYLGLAFATDLWQVVLVVFVERALGWPMFLASSNAMTADLVRLERRPEAYGVLRTAIMAGVVAGPALAGIALGAGVGLSRVFLIAGVGCLGFLVPLLLLLRETRPGIAGDDAPDGREAVAGVETAARGEADGDTGGAGGGYRDVLRDRRFLAFCAVALLPLFCLGQLYSTFPVMVTGEMGLPASSWGLLVSAYALMVAAMQLPIVRVTRRRDAMLRLSVASACFGVGLGGAAFAAPGWQLVGLLGVLAVGEVLFSPVSSTVVTGLAPPALRGRYLGAWTLVWMFGLSLGPTAGGLLMDVLGGRGLFGLVLVAGVFGAAAFPLLRRQGRSRVAPSFRHARRG